MIRPPGGSGVAFSEAPEGDIRGDDGARERFCEMAGIPRSWATVNQVHGNNVVRATGAGHDGDADAVWTTVPGVAVAVFTADCFGVVLTAADAVGVAHAGWRGAQGGVVEKLREAMSSADHAPTRAFVGPGIGPCCFEVGNDVWNEFPDHRATTSWGSDAVDLAGAVGAQLGGLDVWTSGRCTHHDEGFYSHRRDGTEKRLAAVGWIP